VQLLLEHERRALASVNLVASENVMSPAARIALGGDLAHRYCLPPEEERLETIWDYPNQSASREIERLAKQTAITLFHGVSADLRPLSGNNIAGIVLSSLARRGDLVLTVPFSAGGHFATAPVCDLFGLHRQDLPYDSRTGRIDLDQCRLLARTKTPMLIYLDASMILFPHPVADLREIFGPQSTIVYDASHCFGLIAGGAFQSPLTEGADLIVGSTHKSMFGPQKGMIVARDDGEAAERIYEAITPHFVSNSHVHHIAALAIALEELTLFGADYAAAVIRNARLIGDTLDRAGIHVLFPEQGFTESHQLLCVLDGMEAGKTLRKLELCGIHVNGVRTPFIGLPGLRLGAAEITRRGFRADAVIEVARCLADALQDRCDSVRIAQRVGEISSVHTGVAFGFDSTGKALRAGWAPSQI
jgi:glycine hydroxymethyltransferase